ncbi:ABC transporter permease [Streptomyces sp. NPDC018031]|uniref:ABC transporter permease n=1 Tax=Streptomyces sp. NPDC018031 TaxID=3365033 RepID=UPI0037AD7319
MLTVVFGGLRSRWTTLVGPFVALALGVGVIATMGLTLAGTLGSREPGPQRLAAAPVVVRSQGTLPVPVIRGPEVRHLSLPLAHPPPLRAGLERRLARLGRTVEDRTFPVSASGVPGDTVGHPWSAAAFTPYRLVTGRAPSTAREVVVTSGTAKVGQTILLRDPSGTAERIVVGVTGSSSFESAVFFTDAEAARVSPRLDQLVVYAPAAEVRRAVVAERGVAVLTGQDRRRADPGPAQDAERLTTVNALLGTAAGVTGFVCVSVMASTFAFAVAQRRQEFGLLRLIGAGPGRLRLLVFAEAAVVGAAASAAGCLLGWWGAPWLARRLVAGDVAPAWFTVPHHQWPLHLAFWTGMVAAFTGVWAAARRAGKVSPVDALRAADVDTGTLPVGRWLLGGLLLLAGVSVPAMALMGDPGELLRRKTYTTQPLLLIGAVGLLAPLVVRPMARAFAVLPARLPGAAGLLAAESAAGGVRRTSAVAAPVLITVALTGSLLGAAGTVSAAKAAELRAQTRADFVVTAGAHGLSPDAVGRVLAVPGVVASPTSSTAVAVREEKTALVRSDARAVDPARFAAVGRPPVIAGALTDLDDGSIVVTEEWERHRVGELVTVWLGDGSRRALRIAAVLRTGTGDNGAYVTARNARGAAVDRIDVRLRPGADASETAAALRSAVRADGGEVLDTDDWVAAVHPRTSPQTRLGLWVVLGIAVIYACIGLANSQLMAVSDRIPELRALGLAGATRGQVLLTTAAEALLAVSVGAVLGAAVAAVELLALWVALGRLPVDASPVVPWAAMGAAVAVCALVAVVAAVLSTWCALRPGRAVFASGQEATAATSSISSKAVLPSSDSRITSA